MPYQLVEIVHKPIKELIIMEYVEYPKADTLAQTLAITVSAGQPAALYWTEGIVFIPFPFPIEAEGLAEEYLQGKAYWSSVAFALMPSFQPNIRVGGIEIPIIDISPNSTMREVARWLKERSEKGRI